LPRVSLLSPFDQQFFAGRTEIECEAANLFALVRALDAIAPGFGKAAESRSSFVVNGMAVSDWTLPLAPDSEVIVVPRISGG